MKCNLTDEIVSLSKSNPKATEYDSTLLDLWLEIAHLLPTKLGKTLDIGCAYGTYTAFLNQYGSVYACDVEDMRDKAWFDSLGIKFKNLNLETDPIPGDYRDFDSVFLTEVIEHFNYSPIKPLEKIYKMLKDGGKLYITTPTRTPDNLEYCKGRYCEFNHYMDIPESWEKYEFIDAHHHIYSGDELCQAVEEAGFKIVGCRPIRGGKHYFLTAVK